MESTTRQIRPHLGPASDLPADLSKALAWVDEDRELLEELIAVFLEDAPIRLSAIRAAIQAGDGPNLREAAHTLKGSAAALGAFGARALAQELEDLGKDNALADAPAAAYRLEAELERVAAFLGR